MISNELFVLYTTITDDDAEIDHSDKKYVASNQSESDNDVEEEDLQTPVIPVTKNTMARWESSQWYNSTRYDYTSEAFLDMGSGSPIDEFVESGTLRLLIWNDSMTDIHEIH
ncbi:hypothetical protein M9H77_18978 [Catharanthus roseus]|uniref:Uncharacterized protein n=1 Tax=Catharanthus roseus TaxID=4058 RepID=A0ACC0B8Z8_CATRO|nr:hypothetical protein M9H77_18978 [Catharanthus roseus]